MAAAAVETASVHSSSLDGSISHAHITSAHLLVQSNALQNSQQSRSSTPSNSQEIDNSFPEQNSPKVRQSSPKSAADVDSDDEEPVVATSVRNRGPVRRLAIASDDESDHNDEDTSTKKFISDIDDLNSCVASKTAPTDKPSGKFLVTDAPSSDSGSDDVPAPIVRSRSKRRPAAKHRGSAGADSGESALAAPHPHETGSGDEEEIEEKKKAANMRRLMALGDESSDDEMPGPGKEENRQLQGTEDTFPDEEIVSSAGKRKSSEKKQPRKSAKEAAENMREIRSTAQRRVRESRLNLPYARPRQRTLQEFMARRGRIAVLPESIRIRDSEAEAISRRLQEKEKEIDDFYAPASEEEDNADPEWTPATAATSQADPTEPAGSAAVTDTPPVPATTSDPAAAAQDRAVDAAESEEDAVVSQSSQKVQEWLETVHTDADAVLPPPMCDAPAGGGVPGGPAPAASDVRSVSGETETSLAAGDSASAVAAAAAKAADAAASAGGEDARVAEITSGNAVAASDDRPAITADPSAATATCVPVTTAGGHATVTVADATATTPAAAPPRRAALAELLPPSVLKATPRLDRATVGGGDTISLDSDSASESAQEPADLDKFVERFVRHSTAVVRKHKPAEKKTVNISLVRMESDSAGGQQLVADSVPVTLTSGGDPEPDSGPPGAQRAKLQAVLRANIRTRREEARQRRQREHNMYNNEEVDDSYLDDLPDEEEELSDVSSSAGESEPEPEPPLVETKRRHNPLLDEEAQESGAEDEEATEEIGNEGEDGTEMKLVLEGDDDDDGCEPVPSPRRSSVITEPELFSTQPSQPRSGGDAASLVSHDSDLTGSLVTAHQPGGGFKYGGTRPVRDEDDDEAAPLPATQPFTPVPLPVEDSQLLAPVSCARSVEELSQLPPLRLTPDLRPAQPRSAIGALLDPAADDTFDDLMSLCSGKFDGIPPSGKSANVALADTQPAVDLLSLPAPTNKDGYVSWPDPDGRRVRPGDRSISPLDLFEDGNAQMPLELTVVDSEAEEDAPRTADRVRKRRRRLVFSDDDESGADRDGAGSSCDEGSGEDSLPPGGRAEHNDLPIDFTGFLDTDKRKKMVRSAFFEGEAELSGSEEPSDDEDDGDELDQMDEEEADREQLDEGKLRQQVERIHQKKALDDDIREMKLFQERFLEDGDLEGRGRERKFRWSNTEEGDELERRTSDDEADPVQEDGDEQWRRQRHEREKWLSEHAGKTEEAKESESVTFLRPGQRPVRRLLSATGRRPPAPAAPAAAQAMPPSPLRAQKVSRGSFLRRGREALARLASTARSLSLPAGAGSRPSANRTFSTSRRDVETAEQDPQVEEEFRRTVDDKTTKRKAVPTSEPPGDHKRPKVSRSFSALAEDSQSSSLFSVIL